MVLEHMTGLRQGKESFIASIVQGELRYRSIKLVKLEQTLNGSIVSARAFTETEASVYGGGYRLWRLLLDIRLQEEPGGWKITVVSASTY